jgi:hypothetical protein
MCGHPPWRLRHSILSKSVAYGDKGKFDSWPSGAGTVKPPVFKEMANWRHKIRKPEENGYQLATLWNFAGLFGTRAFLGGPADQLKPTT